MAFQLTERARLLAAPRIGPAVVQRLEQVGLDSFAKLRQVGVEEAIRIVCAHVGHSAWGNRRRALQSALQDDPALEPH